MDCSAFSRMQDSMSREREDETIMRMVTLFMEPEHQRVSWSIIASYFLLFFRKSERRVIQNRQRPSWPRYFGKVGTRTSFSGCFRNRRDREQDKQATHARQGDSVWSSSVSDRRRFSFSVTSTSTRPYRISMTTTFVVLGKTDYSARSLLVLQASFTMAINLTSRLDKNRATSS